MCLILFAYKSHPKYSLIVAANRDEFYKRKTASAHFWEDEPNILAGRDLEKMGTWLGITKEGNFAALTNYRNPNEKTEGKRSRGELVTSALKSFPSIKSYMEQLGEKRGDYPGYNLIAGNLNDLYYYSNVENKVKTLRPGIYGLSNHLLNSNWPKVKEGKKMLSRIIEGKEENLVDSLFQMLKNEQTYPDSQLPSTGVSLEMERLLSSMFIRSEDYGTRSSSVLLFSEKEIQFFERIYDDGIEKEQSFIISS